MKHNADVLASNELKRKTKLAGTILTSASNNDDLMQRLNNIANSRIGDDQESFARKDSHDFVTTFAAKIKQEQ